MIPERVKIYVTNWAVNNPDSYKRFFGEAEIHNLLPSQMKELLRIAHTHDSIGISNSFYSFNLT